MLFLYPDDSVVNVRICKTKTFKTSETRNQRENRRERERDEQKGRGETGQ